jgi:hypothetical protein
LLLEFQVKKSSSILFSSFYAFSGIGFGFLYYTLTEGITPAFVIFFFYFLIRAKNSKSLEKKRSMYVFSFLLFGFLFFTRPVLGILALPIPFFIFWDVLFKIKEKLLLLTLFGIIGFGPMVAWQIRAYNLSGVIVGLHPIYSIENSQTPYRPVHKAFWELAKSWGEKGANFHSYTDEFWSRHYENSQDSSSVEIIITKIAPSVVSELGENRLKEAFTSYRLAILEQRDYFSESSQILKGNFPYERKAIEQFNNLKSEYRKNHFWFYHFVEPLSVLNTMIFHSNLSLHLFQHTYRGNFLMESWRLVCFIFHSFVFLTLPIGFFFKAIPFERKLVLATIGIYIFYLIYFQRGIEERYSLPILPMLIVNLAIVFPFLINKVQGRFRKE